MQISVKAPVVFLHGVEEGKEEGCCNVAHISAKILIPLFQFLPKKFISKTPILQLFRDFVFPAIDIDGKFLLNFAR